MARIDFRFLFGYSGNMLEKIDEPIEIIVEFRAGQVLPRVFKWRGKKYNIEKINMVHKERQGNEKIYYFSVSDNANFFRLAFSTRDLSWRLEKIFFEG